MHTQVDWNAAIGKRVAGFGLADDDCIAIRFDDNTFAVIDIDGDEGGGFDIDFDARFRAAYCDRRMLEKVFGEHDAQEMIEHSKNEEQRQAAARNKEREARQRDERRQLYEQLKMEFENAQIEKNKMHSG